MNIAKLQSLMSQYGLSATEFEELSHAANQLPASNIAVLIPTLSEVESATLMSRLLRRLAPEVGAVFEHPDVIEQAKFAVAEPRRLEGDAEETEQYAGGSAA